MTELEQVLDNPNYRKILNRGFVGLVDVMPKEPGAGDAAIVQAARVSYGKGTKQVSQDRALIRYLLRNDHTSPFEMVEFKFHLKIPIFVSRQLIRHRTANVNEYSGRYSLMTDEFYIPEKEWIKSQSVDNKQGRGENLSEGEAEKVQEILEKTFDYTYEVYLKLLGKDDFVEKGIARELARIVLPTAIYTEKYWKIDLHNLLRFLRLRLDEHAQYEIREVSKAILDLIRPYVPMTIEAWEDYVVNSIKLSKQETELLFEFLNGKEDEILEKIKTSDKLSKTEKLEMTKKLEKFFFSSKKS